MPETYLLQTLNWDILWLIPIEIPSVVITMVQLSDLAFYYYDGYIMIGLGLNWLPWELPFTIDFQVEHIFHHLFQTENFTTIHIFIERQVLLP